MEHAKGVRLIVTPMDMMRRNEIKPPAVIIDNEVIAMDKGMGNGKVSEALLEETLAKHGAEILNDD